MTTTTIKLTSETKARLDKHGKKGDTYDDILNLILDNQKTNSN